MAKVPVSTFVASSKGSRQEEGALPKMRNNDGFDPNAYKLIKKSTYDFNKPTSLGMLSKLSLTASTKHKRRYISKRYHGSP